MIREFPSLADSVFLEITYELALVFNWHATI